MSLDIWLSLEVDTGRDNPEALQLHEANITHNLGKMAAEAGIYQQLWRMENCSEIKTAGDLVEPLKKAIQLMAGDPARFRAFDAENGWGTYDQFLPWLQRLMEACERYPKATVETSK